MLQRRTRCSRLAEKNPEIPTKNKYWAGALRVPMERLALVIPRKDFWRLLPPLKLISFLKNFSRGRCAGNYDAESGLTSYAVLIYTSTEPVLQSIHFARSCISLSGAALRRHHGTLLNKNMELKGFFFEKSSGQSPPLGTKGEVFSWNSLRVGRCRPFFWTLVTLYRSQYVFAGFQRASCCVFECTSIPHHHINKETCWASLLYCRPVPGTGK